MACANGYSDIVKLLLKQKAQVNALNKSKNTPLHWAALNGRTNIIELLLAASADPNLKNEFEHVPLEEALQNGYTEAAEILAKVTKLADDKIYTSIVEAPEGEEEEKKEEMFNEDDMQDDDEEDKRSIQSEEAIKPEVLPKPLTPEQIAALQQQK